MSEFNLSFELNQQEEKQIEKIDEEIDKKIQDLRFDDPRYWACMDERNSKIIAITKKARVRTIKEYKNRPHELRLLLEKEIQDGEIFYNPELEGEELRAAQNRAKDDEIAQILPYLKVLEKKSIVDYEAVIACIEKFVGIKEKSKVLSLMFDGKATQALARARTGGTFDPLSRTLKIKSGVNIFLPDSALKIGVGTSKIFRYAVSEITKRNHQNAKGEKLNLRFLIDVKEYARLNGVDINSEDAMKNFRRKLKENLETLKQCGLTWTEKIKGQPQIYSGMNYIGKYELKSNSLMIEFTLTMAEYLTSLPILSYPHSLYGIDDREFNAFAIGEAMCIHYSQENNVIRGTEGKLRVETLLTYSSFPTYEELKEHKWSWEEKVKEPLERALDILYQCGFLKDYSFCYEGGVEISDKEMRAGAIDSYEKFISLIVKYELKDFPKHEKRIAEITQKKAEQIAKINVKRKNKKKADNNSTDE